MQLRGQRPCDGASMPVLMRAEALFVIFLLRSFVVGEHHAHYQRTEPLKQCNIEAHVADFDWNAVPANSYINYTACYDGFECTRLEVPVDWTNLSNPNTVQLAIIRLPALVPETDPSFGGTILINPGGPGGSGVDVMRWTGNGIRDILDGKKHFELLSWDPRGIHHTTPRVSCFEDDFQRDVWTYRNSILGPMDESEASLIQKWALAESRGKLCECNNPSKVPDGSSAAQFTTTALVARDMVEIIDQVDIRRTRSLIESRLPQLQHAIKGREPALLNYWGYSYGSYLGNTFASMFPSRVGRMALDSVVDTEDYTATGWFSNLLDYNRTLEVFCEDCFEAGPSCALNHIGVASPTDMVAKIYEILQRLKTDPIPIVHNQRPDIVTFADVSTLLLTTMYYPTWSWPQLAQILADLYRSNGTLMAQYLPQLSDDSQRKTCDETGWQLLQGRNKTQAYPPGYPEAAEAAPNILCGDGEDITGLDLNDWLHRMAVMRWQSPVVGWLWAQHTMACVHWPKSWRPAERNRFLGPWSSQLRDYDARASPLLFIGGTADPVLPLRNAYKAAARHEGSRVLVQDAPGHCSGYVNPVQCTWNHVREFFSEGVLPENGTVCKRDSTAWSKSLGT